MKTNYRTYTALVAIHNYILEKDPIEITDMLPPSNDDIADRIEDNGELATEHPRRVEKDAANLRCDQIAARMWDDYQTVLRERGM